MSTRPGPTVTWATAGVPDHKARATVPICSAIAHRSLTTNQHPRIASMSHSQLTAASSSNLQLMVNNALEAYKKRTKHDLLAHPLAPQLKACDSPGAVLAILQQQVQGLDHSRSRDDRWTKWLEPTVNVLFAFSVTLGAGVGLVCSRTSTFLRYALLYLFGRCFHPRVWFLRASAFYFRCVSSTT